MDLLLLVTLDGQVRITKEQVQILSKEIKERIAARQEFPVATNFF